MVSMKPITQIAEEMGLDPKAIIPYGHYMAKVPLEAIRSEGLRGKLILVTGMTPTPGGEGKTTVSVGLTQGLAKLGHRPVVTLRQPSLGPVFGIKGGGTGGGLATVVPEEEINLHFTGDMHAVASAHNLLAALVDNAVYRGSIPEFEASGVEWRRTTDASDRALRQVVMGMGGSTNSPLRESGFDIVAASQIMAILALASDLDDLRRRVERTVVGMTSQGQPVTVGDLKVTGALLALLRHAIKPNLVQTREGQAALVHTGPFGNIAHGCGSVVADRLALGYADYVVTEAGFGADLGFEKFMHIKARPNQLEPNAAVLVASVRALKWHGGIAAGDLPTPNEKAVEEGAANLEHLVGVVRRFGLPVVVAINRFHTDTDGEISVAQSHALAAGAEAAPEIRAFLEGGDGSVELAEAVAGVATSSPNVSYIYPPDAPVEEKVMALAREVYGASDVDWNPTARRRLQRFESLGWGRLPICMAKTPLSLSHDPALRGRPSGYMFPIVDIRVSTGAGYVYPLAGRIETLPGLPSKPRALDLDVDDGGNVVGLG